MAGFYSTRRWRRIRDSVLEERGYRCEECSTEQEHTRFNVDHVVARAIGGTDEAENLRVLCKSCHGKKTATYDRGFGNRRKFR